MYLPLILHPIPIAVRAVRDHGVKIEGIIQTWDEDQEFRFTRIESWFKV